MPSLYDIASPEAGVTRPSRRASHRSASGLVAVFLSIVPSVALAHRLEGLADALVLCSAGGAVLVLLAYAVGCAAVGLVRRRRKPQRWIDWIGGLEFLLPGLGQRELADARWSHWTLAWLGWVALPGILLVANPELAPGDLLPCLLAPLSNPIFLVPGVAAIAVYLLPFQLIAARRAVRLARRSPRD